MTERYFAGLNNEIYKNPDFDEKTEEFLVKYAIGILAAYACFIAIAYMIGGVQ